MRISKGRQSFGGALGFRASGPLGNGGGFCCGGGEWESNPPRTVRQPLPDLKSGRPTGSASPPPPMLTGGPRAAKRQRGIAARPPQVAASHGDPSAVEVVQDLDGQLPPVAEPVAELRRREGA